MIAEVKNITLTVLLCAKNYYYRYSYSHDKMHYRKIITVWACSLYKRYRASFALYFTLFCILFALTWTLEELTFQERRARARKNSSWEELREVAVTPLRLLRFYAVLRTAPAISGLQSRLIIIGLIWSVAQTRDRITCAVVTAVMSVRLILRGDTFIRVKDDV